MKDFADFDVRQWLANGFVENPSHRVRKFERKRAGTSQKVVLVSLIASTFVLNVTSARFAMGAQSAWNAPHTSVGGAQSILASEGVPGIPSIYWARLAKEIGRLPQIEESAEIDFPPLV